MRETREVSPVRIPHINPERQPITTLAALSPQPTYDQEITDELVTQRDKMNRNTGTALLAEAAIRLGAQTQWLNSSVALAQQDSKSVLLMGYRGGISRIGATITSDKLLTKRLLVEHGVSTPRGRRVRSAEDAVRFQQELGRPIVVKPRSGFGGKAVRVDLRDHRSIESAFDEARAHGSVVAEEYIDVVEEYRCLTTPQQCVSIVARILPWVEGDGVSSIRDLIHRNNAKRDLVPSTWHRPTPADGATETYLAGLGLSLSDVLPAGKRVTVRNVGGLSSGGEPFECSQVVDPTIGEFAVSAAQAIPGLHWSGVDVMVSREGRLYIVEINSSPDTLGSRFPLYGTPVPVPEHMFHSRIAAAPPIRSGRTTTPPLLAEPAPVYSPVEGEQSRTLSSVLRDRVKALGWHTKQMSPQLVRLTTADKTTIWMRGTATNADLDIVHRTLHRHSLIRRLLRNSRVARPNATNVTSISGVERFLALSGARGVLMPSDSPWGGKQSLLVHRGETHDLGDLDPHVPHLLQAYVQGRRYKAIATPNSLLALLGEDAMTADELEKVTMVSVSALRAIPELRWALVDVVIRPERPLNPLIEGIRIDTEIMPSEQILAGSLTEVWDLILASDCQ